MFQNQQAQLMQTIHIQKYCTRYEGHSINKLQNSIILLVFQILKKSEIYILSGI